MVLRKTPFALDEYYHLYSRGVDKRKIFLDAEDEKRFIRLLFICNGERPIIYKEIKSLSLSSIKKGDSILAIGAFCIMPNHFHILAKEVKEGGISKFMRKLLTAYSSYFNKKYARTGTLLGSRFKSAHLDTDEYLKYMFSYIHLNPIKILDSEWHINGVDRQQAEAFLSRYKGSSYPDYSGQGREESLILNKLAFPEYFVDSEEFKSNIFDWLSPPFQGPSLENWG